ncbi:MAG: PaaI family thioesterase [Bryobacteraceae bacterium]
MSDQQPLSLPELRKFVSSIPFNELLGIRLVRAHKDGVTIECNLRDELLNASGVLHGGVTATMADVAVGIAITHQLGRPRAATTIEMKLNYLRPVIHGKIVARAKLLRVGQTVCCGSVSLYDSAKQLVGSALVTYMLLK